MSDLAVATVEPQPPPYDDVATRPPVAVREGVQPVEVIVVGVPVAVGPVEAVAAGPPQTSTTVGAARITIEREAATDRLGITYGSHGGKVVMEVVDPSGIGFAAGLRVGMTVIEVLTHGERMRTALGDDPARLTAAMAGQTVIALEVFTDVESAAMSVMEVADAENAARVAACCWWMWSHSSLGRMTATLDDARARGEL